MSQDSSTTSDSSDSSVESVNCELRHGDDVPWPEPSTWTATVSDVQVNDPDPNGPFPIYGRDFVSHSLSHLQTRWDTVGDPNGVGGCWRHTFQLTAIGLHAEYDETEDEYATGWIDRGVETFMGDRVAIRTDGDAVDFGDFDGSDDVVVSARRDSQLFGFLDGMQFQNELRGLTDPGAPVDEQGPADPHEHLAKAIFESADVGYDAGPDGVNLSQLKKRLAAAEAIDGIITTGATMMIPGRLAILATNLSIADDVAKTILESYGESNTEHLDAAFDTGISAGYELDTAGHPAAGHNVVFDVYVPPGASGRVSVESWLGDEDKSARWVVDTGAPAPDPCAGTCSDALLQPRAAPTTVEEEAAPRPDLVQPAESEDAYLTQDPQPNPILDVYEDGDLYVFDASNSTGGGRPIERYEYVVRRNYPDDEAGLVKEVEGGKSQLCLEITEPGNYEVELTVAERDPESGDLVTGDRTYTDHFTVGETTANIAAPLAGTTFTTEDTVEFDASGTIFADEDPARVQGGTPVRTTWRVRDGETVLWSETSPGLTHEADAAEMFGNAEAGTYEVELDVSGPSRVADTTSVTVEYEPVLTVVASGPDDGELGIDEEGQFEATVYGAVGEVAYDWQWEMRTPSEFDSLVGPYSIYEETETITFSRPHACEVVMTATVEDDVGTASDTVEVDVYDPMTVSLDGPEGGYLDPSEGYEFEPEVEGTYGPVEIQWDYWMDDYGPVSYTSGDTFTLPFSREDFVYRVQATVEGHFETVSDSVTFEIGDPPDLSVTLDTPTDPVVGEYHVFQPEVTNAIGDLEYTWYHSVDDSRSTESVGDRTYRVDFDATESHYVRVKVEDGDRSAWATASFRVQTLEESDQSMRAHVDGPDRVREGDEARIVATVEDGFGPFEYEWSLARYEGDERSGHLELDDEDGPVITRELSGTKDASFQVTVTDEATGETASGGHGVTVDAVDDTDPRRGDNSDPISVWIDGVPSTATEGQSTTAVAVAEDAQGSVEYTWSISRGNGWDEYEGSDTPTWTYDFDTPGEVGVRVEAEDLETGESDVATTTVAVDGTGDTGGDGSDDPGVGDPSEPISVGLDGVPPTATEGDSTEAIAVVQNAADGIEYEWSISQGQGWDAFANSDEPTWTYDFQTATEYGIKVEVEDLVTGGTASATETVDVQADTSDGGDDQDDGGSDDPRQGDNSDPVSVDLQNVPTSPTEGDSATVSTVVHDAVGEITYTWSISQGSASYSEISGSDSPTWTFDFDTATSYNIKVEVVDEATDESAGDSTTVQVQADDSGGSDGGDDGGNDGSDDGGNDGSDDGGSDGGNDGGDDGGDDDCDYPDNPPIGGWGGCP